MSILDNPKHWRDRADETRAKADQLWYNEEAQQRLLRIAQEYERLAEHAEIRSQVTSAG